MVKMKEQIITSKNNHFIKELSKLTNKKYRYKLGLVILEGKKIINECLIRNKDIKFLIVLAICTIICIFILSLLMYNFVQILIAGI